MLWGGSARHLEPAGLLVRLTAVISGCGADRGRGERPERPGSGPAFAGVAYVVESVAAADVGRGWLGGAGVQGCGRGKVQAHPQLRELQTVLDADPAAAW